MAGLTTPIPLWATLAIAAIPAVVAIVNSYAQYQINNRNLKINSKKENLAKITSLIVEIESTFLKLAELSAKGELQSFNDPSPEIKILIHLYFPSLERVAVLYCDAVTEVFKTYIDFTVEVAKLEYIEDRQQRTVTHVDVAKVFSKNHAEKHRIYKAAKNEFIIKLAELADTLD